MAAQRSVNYNSEKHWVIKDDKWTFETTNQKVVKSAFSSMMSNMTKETMSEIYKLENYVGDTKAYKLSFEDDQNKRNRFNPVLEKYFPLALINYTKQGLKTHFKSIDSNSKQYSSIKKNLLDKYDNLEMFKDENYQKIVSGIKKIEKEKNQETSVDTSNIAYTASEEKQPMSTETDDAEDEPATSEEKQPMSTETDDAEDESPLYEKKQGNRATAVKPFELSTQIFLETHAPNLMKTIKKKKASRIPEGLVIRSSEGLILEINRNIPLLSILDTTKILKTYGFKFEQNYFQQFYNVKCGLWYFESYPLWVFLRSRDRGIFEPIPIFYDHVYQFKDMGSEYAIHITAGKVQAEKDNILLALEPTVRFVDKQTNIELPISQQSALTTKKEMVLHPSAQYNIEIDNTTKMFNIKTDANPTGIRFGTDFHIISYKEFITYQHVFNGEKFEYDRVKQIPKQISDNGVTFSVNTSVTDTKKFLDGKNREVELDVGEFKNKMLRLNNNPGYLGFFEKGGEIKISPIGYTTGEGLKYAPIGASA